MNKQLLSLHLERQHLKERIAQQRAELDMQLMPLRKASDVAHRFAVTGRGGIDFVRSNSLLLLAAVATVLVLRPRGLARLAQTGLTVWRGWRALRALVPPAVLSSLVVPIYKFMWQRFAGK